MRNGLFLHVLCLKFRIKFSSVEIQYTCVRAYLILRSQVFEQGSADFDPFHQNPTP